MPEAEVDRDLLCGAALEAGRIARFHAARDLQVRDKGDGQGPVTAADLAVDRMLRETLTAARPDYAWLSEETPDDGARLGAARVFVVDPIDGTRAFIAGEESWAHSLAVVEHGQPVAAAIYLPMKDRLYAAALGAGATRDGWPVAPSGRDGLEGAEVLGAKPAFRDHLWDGGAPPVTRRWVSSLAFRLALVAEGRFDAMLTLRDAWEWDIAAGALIVTEAGGRAETRGGAALRFNNPAPKVAGVVAGTPAVQAGLVTRLSEGARA